MFFPCGFNIRYETIYVSVIKSVYRLQRNSFSLYINDDLENSSWRERAYSFLDLKRIPFQLWLRRFILQKDLSVISNLTN
jgi:hypothetical protein